MTDVNHRRKNRKPVNQRYADYEYHNGYGTIDGERGKIQRVGNTDYLDKSMHSWGRTSLLSDKDIGAGIGNDYTNGHRGMAKALTVDNLDFTQFNIIYSMVRSIEEAQDGFESQLDNHRTVMDQLLKLRRRIKRDKDEVNIFVNVLNEKIKDREKKIEELHFEIKMADHLLEELNLYSSEAELVRAWQSHSTNMWSSNTSSSFTNSTLYNVRVVYNQEM